MFRSYLALAPERARPTRLRLELAEREHMTPPRDEAEPMISETVFEQTLLGFLAPVAHLLADASCPRS